MTPGNDDRSWWDSLNWPLEFSSGAAPNASAQPRKLSRFRLLVVALLALFLVWAVLTRSLVAYLAEANPELALGLRSTDPAALLNLAEDRLNVDEAVKLLDPALAPLRDVPGPGSSYAKGVESEPNLVEASPPPSAETESPQTTRSAADYAQIRSWVELAITQDPLNARAFRILGQISSLTSDREATAPLMQAAARRSHLESVAVYWMMRKSYQDRDYHAALGYADTLLRTRPQAILYVMPLLGKLAEVPDAGAELKQLLAGNPPWRPAFFAYFSTTITDARTPLDVLLTLKDTATPPTADDLRPYLDFLNQHKFYDLAYYTWLQFLPAEQLAKAGHLFNGDFESASSGMPFDWVITKGSGVSVQIGALPEQGGEHGLYLEFGPGRVDYKDVTQLIILAPGSYRFKGKYRGEIVSQRGLGWRILCAGAEATPIGQGPTVRGSASMWTDFDFSFAVPEANCPAQHVSLVFDARSASEEFISGSIWFDDLGITREANVDSRLNQ